MNNFVLIKFDYKDEPYIIKKILNNNISIFNSYQKNRYVFYKLSKDDYKLLSRVDYKKSIKYVKSYDFNYALKVLKQNIEKILLSAVIVIIIFISKLIIIKVNIHTNDKNLEKLIKYSLEDENIKNFSEKKSFRNIENIKNKILKKYKNDIEWIEIKNSGYYYDVYIIKRKKKEINEESNRCNYVAIKSGTVKSVTAKKGVLLTQENNFVNAGDILISGQIIYNEELKKEICASGKVYGEVWYKVNVSFPLTRKILYKQKNGKYNIVFNFFNKKYKIFNDKANFNKSIVKIGFKNINLKIIKSEKYKEKNVKLKEKEGEKNALKKARKNVLLKASRNAKIIDENILKKYTKNDKIYLEVLISVEEEIGVVENF